MEKKDYGGIRRGANPIPPDMLAVVDWVVKHYQFTAQREDWVPGCVIREIWERDPGHARVSTQDAKARFGIAVGLGFDFLDPYGVGAPSVIRRMTVGRAVRGWSDVAGPGGLRLDDKWVR